MSANRVSVGLAWLALAATAFAQSVILPAPRLLTTMPMGAQVGTTVEVAITGEELDGLSDLLFSTPKITAKAKPGEANKFLVTVAADAPAGVHDARFVSRLGISSARAFTVSQLAEVTRITPNTSLETALALKPGSVCNATVTARAVDFYSFMGTKGQRLIAECATAGIDSKLVPVLIVADAEGRDLVVNRTSGLVDFTPPADGKYFLKVHSLTFKGGPEQFYRLALQLVAADAPVPRQATTRPVNSFSWNAEQKFNLPQLAEVEPNNAPAQAQKITLPCEITGRFFPAADVDTFEFNAKKGEVWWIEVASERLGLPTDPFVLVQRVEQDSDKEKLTDVAELNDIPPPMKPSSNGYSYDGPPYDGGSADVLGKLEIKEDGRYRLQLRDLFGGTRSDPANVYRLLIRPATPDFALAAWVVHFELRNGDRNAQSKPLALRPGGTLALEVVVNRRDGFDGEIELGMENLPSGVTAAGLKIPAGKSQGMLLISASEKAPRAIGIAKMVGRAQINGTTVTRSVQLASMAWPVRDASGEIPKPRLMADVPISVTDAEGAPITVAAREDKFWEAKAGEKLTIPLKLTWRSEVSGQLRLRPYGAAISGLKPLEVAAKAETADLVLDLATLKPAPGEHTVALASGYVVKYRHNPAAVILAEAAQKKAEQEVAAVAAEAKKLSAEVTAAPAEKRAAVETAAKAAEAKLKSAEAAKAEAAKRVKAATDAATPKDIADIVVSEPIRIRVLPADKK
ncbi:MAG: serine protease [Proteobacteria bacterium]|nr:serine protease [Verrucomicrobiota bacterium]NBU11029.1 serine protease [Pseudomonadota bacterium]